MLIVLSSSSFSSFSATSLLLSISSLETVVIFILFKISHLVSKNKIGSTVLFLSSEKQIHSSVI
jgi:hypothetical protein